MNPSPANDFDLRSGFFQQDCRFARALASPDHGDLLPPELAERIMFARVTHDFGRQSFEFSRPQFLVRKSRGNDHTAGANDGAVVERQTKSSARRLDTNDPSRVKIGNRALLKPFAVCHEFFERDRRASPHPPGAVIVVQGKRSPRTGYVRRLPRRPKFHPLRHISLPKRHGFAEDHCFDFVRLEMRAD